MFNEKREELGLPVWISPKYQESKKKALELINSKLGQEAGIGEGDFWILMNKTKSKTKMAYTGVIISHNGCLKLNSIQPEEKQFNPSSLTLDKNGWGNSLVYTYSNDEQGIYEVGEISSSNCRNDYPYAMALKRVFDRVVLKITRLAFAGIYSDSEADEFKEQIEEDNNDKTKKPQIAKGQPPSVAADPMFTDSPRQVFSKTVEEDLESQTVSKYNITTLYEIIKGRGKNEEAFKQWVRKEYLKEPEELTRNEYAEIIAVLSTEKKQ